MHNRILVPCTFTFVLFAFVANSYAQEAPAMPASAPAATEPSSQPTTKPSDRLYKVMKAGMAGFIDNTGKVVIPLKLKVDPKEGASVGEFSDGLCQVQADKKWGYIDRTGNFVVQPQYEWADRFSQGLAPVKVDGKFGYIDKTGKMAISPQFGCVWPFSEGLAAFQEPGNAKLGFIDKRGQIVLKPQFSGGGYTFKEGLLWFREDSTKGYKVGFVDTTGKVVIEAKFTSASEFTDGLAVACLEPAKMGFIDKTGKWAIEPKYLAVGNFSEGLVPVLIKKETGEYGYMDKNEKIVIEPQWFHAGRFSEGLARVALLPPGSTYSNDGHMVNMRLVGKFQFGYIDKTGKIVIPYAYDEAEDFIDGVAKVRVDNDKSGYIDRSGKYLWEPTKLN